MHTFIRIAMGLAVALAVSCTREAPVLKAEYRVQVPAEPASLWGKGAVQFADCVRQKTAGRVTIRLCFEEPRNAGASFDAARRTAMGVVDGAVEATSRMAVLVPELNVFGLPFLVGAYANADSLIAGQTGRLLETALRRKGLVLLGWGENGFRYVTNNRRPVVTPADLKGLRIGTAGNPLMVDVLRALGATPVSMSGGETAAALRRGSLDGQENPIQVLLAASGPCQKHMTTWNCSFDPLIFCWNRAQFDALPADIQRALNEAAAEAGRYQKACSRMGLDDGESFSLLLNTYDEVPVVGDPLTYLRSQGMEIVEPTMDQLRTFEAALLPVRRKWIGRVGRAVYEAALADMGVSR